MSAKSADFTVIPPTFTPRNSATYRVMSGDATGCGRRRRRGGSLAALLVQILAALRVGQVPRQLVFGDPHELVQIERPHPHDAFRAHRREP